MLLLSEDGVMVSVGSWLIVSVGSCRVILILFYLNQVWMYIGCTNGYHWGHQCHRWKSQS